MISAEANVNRLRFLEIGDATRKDLRASEKVVAEAVPGILDELYRHFSGFAEL